MTDTMKLTSHQQSDVEAATEVIYSEAADQVIDTRTLGRDLLALVVLFLVLVVYHIQNPLLLFEVQFGTAFRNASLQVALSVTLAISVFAFVRTIRNGPKSLVKKVAIISLVGFSIYGILAAAFDLNLLGIVLNIDQTVFVDARAENVPLEQVQSALTISSIAVVIVMIGIVLLWEPWARLNVYQRALRKQYAPIIVAVVVIFLWETLINVFQIQQFLLPRPSVIADTFSDSYPRLIGAGWNTFQNALSGFLIGCGMGILSGIVASRFISFSKALLPVAIMINAIPIIALAPIFNNWFGILSPTSKIAIVAVSTYFPTMISTVRGLTSVDSLSLELMQSYAASNFEIFRKLRLPSALPFIFSALKVATTLAMIGAIVSEYFGGSTAGLGFRIRDDAGLFKYPEAWSAILVAALFGILFYLVVSAVERAFMSWHVSFREK